MSFDIYNIATLARAYGVYISQLIKYSSAAAVLVVPIMIFFIEGSCKPGSYITKGSK